MHRECHQPNRIAQHGTFKKHKERRFKFTAPNEKKREANKRTTTKKIV